MWGPAALCAVALFHISGWNRVEAVKQHVMLSDSYLPVAMQIIAHLTDQMTYEARDEPVRTTQKPLADAPAKPSSPGGNPGVPAKPPGAWNPTTNKPMYVVVSPNHGSFDFLDTGGWWMHYYIRMDQTTQHHKPGLYAPVAPPGPGERTKPFLLPPDQNSPYSVLGPAEKSTGLPLLPVEDHEIKPLMEERPGEEPLLPPNFEHAKLRTTEDVYLIDGEEVSAEDLQYLSQDLQELIRMGHDDEERLFDLKKGDDKMVHPKAKLSQSNLRLMLLYDLLSRDAKKQRLSDYSGFSPSVMKELLDSANGGARSQLSFALTKMVDRNDCQHDYANNRAKEMIAELARDESVLSNEVRYLQPLVYRL